MGWTAIVMPLSTFADDPAWLSQVAVDPVPDALPAPLPAPSAAQVLTLLRDAGLSGDTAPLVSDDLDHLTRDDAGIRAYAPTTLTDVLLHSPHDDETSARAERMPPDTPVTAVTFGKPHAHAVLLAAAALVPVWGPVVAMEASGCRSLIVTGPVADLEATTTRWSAGT
ncbi:hypothetical protein [Cellulomonas xiejunii]|uniref:Uncharacterized protein n=1 Tax=Cellulomonas xiejunii TaxID=2968083 RepID=A0ABY5KML4_9CELL|nr:hypothetical protein [Cellulomonas xiejunii]MCC2321123.1 hypothetical protein [Cellulomonas xiejunii]UUI71716.1 hypothetical protein NP048_18310 [Cellulomonas xiejunii]